MIERISQQYKLREERLLPVPWCEDLNFSMNKVFTRFRIVGKDKNTGEMKNGLTNMYAIFKTHEECKKPPRTVLIEGDIGIGKTIYCQKLAYYWATSRNNWDESFPMIALVLLLRCYDIKSNLWEAIDEQLLPDDIDEECKENLFKFIRENQSRVLFILDGLDEAVDHGAIDVFINLAQSKELSECFFVFTSRHESGMKMRHYCDNLWEIVGFTLEDTKHFFNKYFGNRKNLAKRLCEEISHSKPDLRQLISNPLNTALLCILYEDSIKALPESRSQLYIEIVKCVLRRYEEKEGISGNNEDIIEVYEEELRSLGRIALQSLLKGELYIEESNENANNFESVNKFGFLSIQSESSKRKPCFRYGFLHKSFQEFFAGFHLALSFLREEDKAEIKITDQRFLYELHQVFLYICGVVAMQSEENAKSLLRKITVCIHMSGANFKEVVRNMKLAFCLIEECGKCKKNLQSQLLHEFGACLQLQACTLRMIPRLDFFLESLSFNIFLTDLDLHLSCLRTMFSRAKIDNKEIALLSQALSVNIKLTHLNLSGNKVGAPGAASLSGALFANTTLTDLNLSGNEIGAAGAASLSGPLLANKTLTDLNLSGNKIGAPGVAFLSEALLANKSLTDLNLSNNEIDASGAKRLSVALIDNTTLTHLNLDGNLVDALGAAYLSHALLANTKLTHLNLDGNLVQAFGATSLSKALLHNTTLTDLNLARNEIDDSGAESLSMALSFSTTLTHLNLSGNEIGVLGAASLSRALLANTTLTDLNLSNNEIDTSGATSLSEALSRNTTLTHLNLSNNEIDISDAISLFEVLLGNTLTHLNFSGNNIGNSAALAFVYVSLNVRLTHLNFSDSNIDDNGTFCLASFLSRNTTLTHLNLSRNSIDGGGALHLSEALSKNTTLTHLNLSRNSIDGGAASHLSRALSKNTTLTHLNLSHNSIDGGGAFHLSWALSKNTTLTHLNFSHNSIDDSGALHLSEALSKNTTLTHLNLSHNGIDDGGALHLSRALSDNTTLTHLNLSGNNIGYSGVVSLSPFQSILYWLI